MWLPDVAADLPPSQMLRRTAVALAEAGQVGKFAGLKARGYTGLGGRLKARGYTGLGGRLKARGYTMVGVIT